MIHWRQDSAFGVGPLGPKDLHWPWHGDGRIRTHKCHNDEIVHTHLGIAPREWAIWFAHVACESWGLMCTSYIPYVVHWSMCLACTVGLNIVHIGAENIGNGRKWPQMRTLMVGANEARVRL